ncbi:MAG: acyl carrier protein [Sedimentisphaerales bacterium]|nr:acyl carrier protein [Sedimentisphaerales bacterium]
MLDKQQIQKMLESKLMQLLPQQKIKPEIDVPLHTLGVDSMRLVELFIFIETEFGIDLMKAGIEMKDIQTIKSISEYIALKRESS